MAEESFKERVRLELIKAAKRYKAVYVDYEYLICSEAFVQKNYYIVDAEKDNFQHLTGVHSQISAQSFFDKCVQGTLSDADFDFMKKGQDEKSVKGTVRRKATADGRCTLGFSDSLKARPKSLIKGNELKNPKPVDLVLKRQSGAELFDEIVIGNETILCKYKAQIEGLFAEDLLDANADGKSDK